MREPQPKAIYLKDYAPPAFRVETIELDVDIREDHALVRAKLAIRRNAPGPLALDGDELELVSVAVDGRILRENEFSVSAEKLSVAGTPEECAEQIARDIRPAGINHLILALADAHLVQFFSGQAIEGVPSIPDQLRLVANRMMPALA